MTTRRSPERTKQPAIFWILLAFNVLMYVVVIPLRMV